MLNFADYYTPLGQQVNFGEAFRSWLDKRYPYTLTDRRWFYGMCILGDPTLRIDRAYLEARSKPLPSKGIQIDFIINGRPDNAGEIYVILASLSGSAPGTVYPGVRIPINWDLMSWALVYTVNSSIFKDGMGILNKDGRATSLFIWDSEIPAAIFGKEITFSAMIIDNDKNGFILATPPVSVKLGSSSKP